MNVEAYLGVLLEGQHDFWGAVPSRRHVFRHEPCFSAGWLGGLDGSRETEIADFEIAVGVEEEVGGFEIAVDDIGGMKSL